MTTKEKFKAPKGWAVDETRTSEDGLDVVWGERTYPDGVVKEILAHSEDEFVTLAEATDMTQKQIAARQHSALMDEANEYAARAKALRDQAKQYDWAV